MTTKIGSFFGKLHKLDKRIVYAVFFLAVLLPLIFPIGIPIKISDNVKTFYGEIEKVQKNDIVLLDLTYDAIGYSDVHYQTSAFVKHLAERKADIYLLCGEAVALNYAEEFRSILEEDFGYVYGTNLYISPYMVGAEQGRKAFSSDPAGTFPNDAYGTKSSSLPLIQRIQSIKDINLVIAVGTSIAHEWWLKQVPDMPMLASIGTSQLPNVVAYLEAGQIKAVLPGVRSAAEYESLHNLPGTQLAKMDAQSLGIITILAFILIGNIGFLVEKKRSALAK